MGGDLRTFRHNHAFDQNYYALPLSHSLTRPLSHEMIVVIKSNQHTSIHTRTQILLLDPTQSLHPLLRANAEHVPRVVEHGRLTGVLPH